MNTRPYPRKTSRAARVAILSLLGLAILLLSEGTSFPQKPAEEFFQRAYLEFFFKASPEKEVTPVIRTWMETSLGTQAVLYKAGRQVLFFISLAAWSGALFAFLLQYRWKGISRLQEDCNRIAWHLSEATVVILPGTLAFSGWVLDWLLQAPDTPSYPTSPLLPALIGQFLAGPVFAAILLIALAKFRFPNLLRPTSYENTAPCYP